MCRRKTVHFWLTFVMLLMKLEEVRLETPNPWKRKKEEEEKKKKNI